VASSERQCVFAEFNCI